MRTSINAMLFVAISALAATASAAQSTETATPSAPTEVSATPAMAAPSPNTATAPAGPRIESASVAFQPAPAAEADVQRSGNSANLGQSRALMIAGGAAVVVGIIIGDDVGTLIAVSGAIVGLYGLYQYLK